MRYKFDILHAVRQPWKLQFEHANIYQEVFGIPFHVVGHPCKLQYDHYINLIMCGQGCSVMPKVFKNNEQLHSVILPLSSGGTTFSPKFWNWGDQKK